jgi:hypothetical protein
MKRIFLGAYLFTSFFSMQTAIQAAIPAQLQNDIKAAYQKIMANDYKEMSAIVKKYTDASSIQDLLGTKVTGKSLLHAAANLSNPSVATQMATRILNQAALVAPLFKVNLFKPKTLQTKQQLTTQMLIKIPN